MRRFANAASVPSAPPLAPSELVLDRYRPLRPLGSGGSGSVWLARDEETGLDLALKIVAKDGKAAARAEREAAAVARLRHERCLRAYRFAADSRHVYIAYEYVPGQTLREAVRGGKLDDAGAIEAAAQILDGLAHAHARGIVHRDVKPANVLLVDAPEISVRLLDFGLAQFAEGDALTATGDVPGTLAYIAPERLRGEPATAASDVWSVGVLLWEALAGTHPFWGAPLLSTPQVIEAGAPPLETARPDLPRRVLSAVERALSVDPARRPTAAELAVDLRGALAATEERQARRRRTFVAGSQKLRLPRPSWSQLLPAAPAAALTAWTAAELPFFPSGWPFLLGAVAGVVAALRPRAGLAFTLAAPVLPLGNIAFGLALAYGALALAWLALCWRDPRSGLVFVAGPLLAPFGALALLPLALHRTRGAIRRAAHAAAGVLLAALVAGARGSPLPFAAAPPPEQLRFAQTESPTRAGEIVWNAVAAHPALVAEVLALAAAAAVLPLVRRYGTWGLAAFGAAMLAATLLPVPAVAAAGLVAAVWITVLALACPPELASRAAERIREVTAAVTRRDTAARAQLAKV